jgi:hypothetical protein
MTYYILDDDNQVRPADMDTYITWTEQNKNVIAVSRPGPNILIQTLFCGHERSPFYKTTIYGADHIMKADRTWESSLVAKTRDHALINHRSFEIDARAHCPVVFLVQMEMMKADIMPDGAIHVFLRKDGRFPTPYNGADQTPDGVVSPRLLEWILSSRDQSDQIQYFSDWSDDTIRDLITRGERMTRFSYRWDYFDESDLAWEYPDVPVEDHVSGWFCWDTATDFSGESNLSESFEAEIECLRHIVEEWGVGEAVYEMSPDTINGVWPWFGELTSNEKLWVDVKSLLESASWLNHM